MGTLAGYLQSQFRGCCPQGWRCRSEAAVLRPELRDLLGYAPRADLLLEREDGRRRLWIEFEISRADPVANHAKFATAHLFQPQPATDTFIAMVSSHVARGRRNLAANTILLMRHIGMQAHQTLLLPQLSPHEIKRLNHLSLDELARQTLDPRSELERAMSISEPIAMTDEYRIHFAGELIEVLYNLQRWNRELSTEAGAVLWNKRTVRYFVYDPRSRLFAPAKFCAFLDAAGRHREAADGGPFGMNVALYTSLDESEPRFDGHRAQVHLRKNLGMIIGEPDAVPNLRKHFENWLATVERSIAVHPRGPRFLAPPAWFR